MKIAFIALFLILDALLLPILVRFCFGDVGSGLRSVMFAMKPDWVSMLDGSYQEDREHTQNGNLFWGVVLVLALLEFWVLSGL